MRLTSRILFGVLLALCWSGLANANSSESPQTLDASAIRAVTNMQLDTAFERFVSRNLGATTLYGMPGPSSMDCTESPMQGGIEICVVTTNGPIASAPAALAQH